MFTHIDWPPEGYVYVPGECPVAKGAQGKAVACNCTGECRGTLVRVDKDSPHRVESLPETDTVWTVPNH